MSDPADQDDKQESVIYCVPMMYENQKPLIDKHCFGDCGKISMGGAVDTADLVGPCWVCCEADCPYERGTVGPVGISELTGDTIYIRALGESESGGHATAPEVKSRD